MRQLHKRVAGLESRTGRPAKLHIVRCYGEQSEDDAINQYGRARIGEDDDLLVLIRKPAKAEPSNGGGDAAE